MPPWPLEVHDGNRGTKIVYSGAQAQGWGDGSDGPKSQIR